MGRPLRDLASLTHPLLDLLNVDTVVHADRDLAKRTGLPVLFEDEQDRLGALARPTAGPRAFLCGGAALVEDAAERLSRLADRAFPVHETVLVERPLPVELPSRGAMQEATLEKSQDGRHVISLEARFPGVLVLAEGWDPGWSVTVDGEQAELRVADHALLGVFLEAGVHQVVFEYSPRGLGPALAAAGAALALLLALLVTAARL
ncbi:MAG: YfhO family protein [Planctomycetes bacterium]|nr:YfhO family protein [Planctomycetota bacterium]